MKISYNWLKQYVDFNLSPYDLAEVLTGVGLEVEEVTAWESVKGGLEGVVIGEVKECVKHPDADKLSITKVDVGKQDYLQIVCGAPNVAAGQKVPVALVGTTLHPASGEPFTIKKAKIRGIESYGMICAEDELGLGESHEGIMVLSAATMPGLSAAEYFKVEKDYVLEIGLTPNRGDAFSHIGVARDLATALNVSYHSPVTFTKPSVDWKNIKKNNSLSISVEVKEPADCPRYSGVTLSGVTVSESPDWLKNRLKAIGVKPINNVVDCTNYVLHEYGQPLHAFDADQINGKKITVQKLAADTAFRTLEDKEIKLAANDLMICDEKGGMCIAGVYGGKESGVTVATTNLFLESAYFTPAGIRQTANRHNLRTDAATHFEKGADPGITITALQRAASLLVELCGGNIASDITDHYPQPIADKQVEINFSRLLQRAGFAIEKKIVQDILRHLEIRIAQEDGDRWLLQVPTFKTDVTREADILEEVLRIYGYNSFALPKQMKSNLSFSPAVNTVKLEQVAAALLTGSGFSEIWTNSVTQSGFEQNEDLQKQQIKVLNSQTTELDSLRTSMLYSGLEVIAYNKNRKQSNLRLYEFGTTYHLQSGEYTQPKHLALWLTGKTFDDNWIAKGEDINFYHLKTVVEQLLRRLGYHRLTTEYEEAEPFRFALCLKNEDETVARLGSVSPSALQVFSLKQEVFYADLNWSYLLDRSQYHRVEYAEPPKYPAVKRDLAMVVAEEVQFAAIEKAAFDISKKLLREVALFDVYKGDKIEQGKKSYAVSFVFQHPDKTLTDQEIEKAMNRLIKKYETDFGASIRKN